MYVYVQIYIHLYISIYICTYIYIYTQATAGATILMLVSSGRMRHQLAITPLLQEHAAAASSITRLCEWGRGGGVEGGRDTGCMERVVVVWVRQTMIGSLWSWVSAKIPCYKLPSLDSTPPLLPPLPTPAVPLLQVEGGMGRGV